MSEQPSSDIEPRQDSSGRFLRRVLIAVCVASWAAAVASIGAYLDDAVNPSALRFDLYEFWVIAIACLTTQLSWMRDGCDEPRFMRAWRVGLDLGHPDLDGVLVHTRRSWGARPLSWDIARAIALVCWALAIAFTIQAWMGMYHLEHMSVLLDVLFLLLAAANHFTVIAVTGPGRGRLDTVYEIACTAHAEQRAQRAADGAALQRATEVALRESHDRKCRGDARPVYLVENEQQQPGATG